MAPGARAIRQLKTMAFALERELQRELCELSLETRRKQQVQHLKDQHKELLRSGVSSTQSGKRKKQQLRARKARLAQHAQDKHSVELGLNLKETVEKLNRRNEEMKLQVALGRSSKHVAEKELSTYFVKETKEQVYLRVAEGRKPLQDKTNQPIRSEEIVRDAILNHPTRPAWSYGASKAQVEDQETIVFDRWLEQIHAKYPHEELNHFEHNLEVWRQLWRVLERSTQVSGNPGLV